MQTPLQKLFGKFDSYPNHNLWTVGTAQLMGVASTISAVRYGLFLVYTHSRTLISGTSVARPSVVMEKGIGKQ